MNKRKCSNCGQEGHTKRNCPHANSYEITVDMQGVVHTSRGKTVHEALDNLDLDYTMVRTKGVIHLKKGKLEASKFFYLRPLRRIVASKLRKAQVGKDLEFLLK